MADRGVAGESLDHLAAGEGVADEAKPPLRMEPAAVEGNDARGLLAAMLQGVQSKSCDGRRFGVAEDAEYAALLAERVAFEIVLQFDRTGVHVVFCGFSGRALYLVHRASLLTRNQRAAGFSISFFRLSRAGLL